MDQTMCNPEVYDFRQYDRIWQRVAPTLDPYPGMNAQQGSSVQQGSFAQQAASARSEAGASASQTVPVQTAPAVPVQPAAPVPAGPGPAMGPVSQLPGAAMNPCCMGTAASEMLDVIAGYIEAALSERRYLLALARQAPSWARQTLRDIAADLQSHTRQLSAAYYLITGQRYRPGVSTERIYVGRWCPALRERYHAAACSGFNYARSADDTTDPCLTRLFNSLSEDAYGHAEELMGLLERQLGMRN